MNDLIEPLMERLSDQWMDEREATRGISYPNMRIFWSERGGLIERRRKWWLFGPWMIRRAQ